MVRSLLIAVVLSSIGPSRGVLRRDGGSKVEFLRSNVGSFSEGKIKGSGDNDQRGNIPTCDCASCTAAVELASAQKPLQCSAVMYESVCEVPQAIHQTKELQYFKKDDKHINYNIFCSAACRPCPAETGQGSLCEVITTANEIDSTICGGKIMGKKVDHSKLKRNPEYVPDKPENVQPPPPEETEERGINKITGQIGEAVETMGDKISSVLG